MSTNAPVVFKKRANRPQPRQKPSTEDVEDTRPSNKDKDSNEEEEAEPENLSVEELIALRKLKRTRKGIDVAKLNKGDLKRKRKAAEEADAPAANTLASTSTFGLQPRKLDDGKVVDEPEDSDDEEAMGRKLVRANNFTQQTNALDVDKHMMAYIEENIKRRRGGNAQDGLTTTEKPYDPQEELFRIEDKYKLQKKPLEEGNVTNSMAMLTAIPEVDLGMDVRLKNIEETEKAKRQVADERRMRNRANKNDDDLASSRFYRGPSGLQSDADALRNAKLQAMGLPAESERRKKDNKTEMATDDLVMERFKKRNRR